MIFACDSYGWDDLFVYCFTCQKNEIPDESDEFETLSIRDDFYVPVIHLYYKDDLTIA